MGDRGDVVVVVVVVAVAGGVDIVVVVVTVAEDYHCSYCCHCFCTHNRLVEICVKIHNKG